jgi:hypothetical protein
VAIVEIITCEASSYYMFDAPEFREKPSAKTGSWGSGFFGVEPHPLPAAPFLRFGAAPCNDNLL